jgi:hypothetical protein
VEDERKKEEVRTRRGGEHSRRMRERKEEVRTGR